MKNSNKILIVLAVILVISVVITLIGYIVIENSGTVYLDYTPPLDEGKMSIEMYRMQNVMPFFVFNIIFSIASIVILYMTKVLGKKALDIILSIFIIFSSSFSEFFAFYCYYITHFFLFQYHFLKNFAIFIVFLILF